MDKAEIKALITLLCTPKIGNKTACLLINHFGSASSVLSQPKKTFLKLQGIGQTVAESLSNLKIQSLKATEIINHAKKNNIQICTFQDSTYPQRLREKEVSDFPLVLYIKGEANLNSNKSLAMVGTRNATGYGKRSVGKIIEEVKCYKDIIVVSGLAYGIDIEVHKSCLKQDIPTIAVLGSGFNYLYPSGHKTFARKIIDEGGALITEYPYFSQVERSHFPNRNRIIAGLSDATLVVESAKKGGALLTAYIAHSYNRVVFAVPGSIESKFSEGTNNLIRKNIACLYSNSQDLNYHLNWDNKTDQNKTHKTKMSSGLFSNLEEEPQKIIDFLSQKNTNISIDDIAQKTAIPLEFLHELLLDLEMENRIERTGEGFKLI